MLKVVVINPTYNEQKNIKIIIKKLDVIKKELKKKSIDLQELVVDDLSSDGTAAFVQKKMKDYPWIFCVTGKKKGLGDAYIRGMQYAIKELKADIVVMMDADLQHNPMILPHMLMLLLNDHKYDMVIGSRYIKGGSYPKEWSKLRILNSKVANMLAIYIAKIKGIKDCTSGYRVIRVKNHLGNVNLDTIHAIGYSFQLMLLYRILQTGAKVVEYPIDFKERKYGKSKIGMNKDYIRDIGEFFLNAIKIRLGYS